MGKKVNFFTVDLYDTVSYTKKDYLELKNLLNAIIERNAAQIDDFLVLDLSRENELHYVADIFSYAEKYLFMRISN